MGSEVSAILADRLYPSSIYLRRIIEKMITPDEGKLLLALEHTVRPSVVANSLNVDEQVVREKLDELARRGLAIRVGDRFRFHRNVRTFHFYPIISGQFADAELLDLWRKFCEVEWYPYEGKMFAKLEKPLHSVIPVRGAFRYTPELSPSRILLDEDVEALLARAELIALLPCACRLISRCDKPLNVCMLFDQGAEHILNEGMGKRISVEEALSICSLSEEAGLVHTLAKPLLAWCNCCHGDGCCSVLEPGLRGGTLNNGIEKSYYRSIIDEDSCNGCQDCIEACPFAAVAMRKPSMTSKKLKAIVDSEKCFGCGICVLTCALKAITMRPVES